MKQRGAGTQISTGVSAPCPELDTPACSPALRLCTKEEHHLLIPLAQHLALAGVSLSKFCSAPQSMAICWDTPGGRRASCPQHGALTGRKQPPAER